MQAGRCYIKVPDVGPCACCGWETDIAEASVAETWLCPGWCTDFYLAELEIVAACSMVAMAS